MKQKLRTLIVIGTILSWSAVALSGVLMFLVSRGLGFGRRASILGISVSQLYENHPVVGMVAVGFTILHVIIEWKIFWVLFKNLLRGK